MADIKTLPLEKLPGSVQSSWLLPYWGTTIKLRLFLVKIFILDLLTNRQDHVIKTSNARCGLRHPLSRQNYLVPRLSTEGFTLSTDNKMVFLTSSQPRMSGAQFQCLELSLVQNRPVRILTLKQGNKFLGIGVIITSDVIPSSGISRHSRITPPPPSQRTSRQVWPCCSGTICWYGRKYYEECRNNCHNRLPSWHLLDIGHHITFSTPWRWQTVRKFKKLVLIMSKTTFAVGCQLST